MKRSLNTSMKLRLLILAPALAFCAASFANLLQNSSFETEGTHGSEAALNWKLNDPDEHGDAWGSAIRADWRAQEGTHIATVRGTWANAGDYGGWWQEAKAEPGTTYKVTGWFWADAGWKPNVQELKLEFWNEDRSTMLGAATNAFNDVGESWAEKEVEGLAPEGAVWARAVVNVTGAGASGALQIDSVELDTTSW